MIPFRLRELEVQVAESEKKPCSLAGSYIVRF